MDELRRLEQLNEQLQLVGKGNDVAERERFCSAFTQEAARLLHAEGWRRIRKTAGANVDGMDIDKLVNKDTFRVVDIIVDAGLSRARVGFNDVDELRDTSRFIEVAPVEAPAPPAPVPPSPPIATNDELLEDMKELINSREQTNEYLHRIATAVETIAMIFQAAAAAIGMGKQ